MIAIGSRKQLKQGKGLRFEIADKQSGFVIEFNDQLFAYQNRCPHLGMELDWAAGTFFDEAREVLVCATHGAQFDPVTGKCLNGPCSGQSLKALKVIDDHGELFFNNN